MAKNKKPFMGRFDTANTGAIASIEINPRRFLDFALNMFELLFSKAEQSGWTVKAFLQMKTKHPADLPLDVCLFPCPYI